MYRTSLREVFCYKGEAMEKAISVLRRIDIFSLPLWAPLRWWWSLKTLFYTFQPWTIRNKISCCFNHSVLANFIIAIEQNNRNAFSNVNQQLQEWIESHGKIRWILFSVMKYPQALWNNSHTVNGHKGNLQSMHLLC